MIPELYPPLALVFSTVALAVSLRSARLRSIYPYHPIAWWASSAIEVVLLAGTIYFAFETGRLIYLMLGG